MTVPALPRIPPPLAEDAATAVRHAGPCSLCRRPINRGDRYAVTVPAGHLAHTACIGLAARRRTVTR